MLFLTVKETRTHLKALLSCHDDLKLCFFELKRIQLYNLKIVLMVLLGGNFDVPGSLREEMGYFRIQLVCLKHKG